VARDLWMLLSNLVVVFIPSFSIHNMTIMQQIVYTVVYFRLFYLFFMLIGWQFSSSILLMFVSVVWL